MIWQIAATVTVLSWLLGAYCIVTDRPYPWNSTTKTIIAGLSSIVFWIALPTAIISLIWSLV